MKRPSASPLTASRTLFLLDVLLVAVAWPCAALLATHGLAGAARPGPLALLLHPAAYLLFLYALGLYRREALSETRKSLSRAFLAAVFGSLAAGVASVILSRPFSAPDASAALFAAAVTCFALCGSATRIALFALHRRGTFRRRILVIGAGRRAWDLAWLLQKEGRSINYAFAFAHDPSMGEIDPRLAGGKAGPVMSAANGFLAIAREFGADQIVVAPDERRGLSMHDLLACKVAGFPVAEYLRVLEKEIGRVDIKRLELGWLLYADGFTIGLIDRALKRLLDITISALVLLAVSPFLAAAAIAVRIDDPGPALYRQARITRGGRAFYILKLRTMRVDAERSGAVWAAERDPRITRIGRFLRRTRLDELPQLINVLRGDMSFVGPRPERPEFTRELAAKLPLYDERHLVKAGLTGWAQVNYPYGASLDDARSKLSYDLYYVKNFGVLFDMLIILQTLRVVLWPGGVR